MIEYIKDNYVSSLDTQMCVPMIITTRVTKPKMWKEQTNDEMLEYSHNGIFCRFSKEDLLFLVT